MRRALGKGLSQLIGEQSDDTPSEVSISSIVPNTRQPRTQFNEETLQELASSIREVGLLQPLLVRPLSEGRYELIAGERRLRASKLAGLRTVPVVVRPAGNQSALELALIENIQREDISALECAAAYRQLIDEFQLTQEQVADKVGKSRTAVTNTLRLLRLPEKIKDGLRDGLISEGHARALLSLDSEGQQLAVYDRILEKGLTVRDVEEAGRPAARKQSAPKQKQEQPSDPNMAALEDALSTYLGSRIKIHRAGQGGRVEIPFYSDDDLDRILEVLGFRL